MNNLFDSQKFDDHSFANGDQSRFSNAIPGANLPNVPQAGTIGVDQVYVNQFLTSPAAPTSATPSEIDSRTIDLITADSFGTVSQPGQGSTPDTALAYPKLDMKEKF